MQSDLWIDFFLRLQAPGLSLRRPFLLFFLTAPRRGDCLPWFRIFRASFETLFFFRLLVRFFPSSSRRRGHKVGLFFCLLFSQADYRQLTSTHCQELRGPIALGALLIIGSLRRPRLWNLSRRLMVGIFLSCRIVAHGWVAVWRPSIVRTFFDSTRFSTHFSFVSGCEKFP